MVCRVEVEQRKSRVVERGLEGDHVSIVYISTAYILNNGQFEVLTISIYTSF